MTTEITRKEFYGMVRLLQQTVSKVDSLADKVDAMYKVVLGGDPALPQGAMVTRIALIEERMRDANEDRLKMAGDIGAVGARVTQIEQMTNTRMLALERDQNDFEHRIKRIEERQEEFKKTLDDILASVKETSGTINNWRQRTIGATAVVSAVTTLGVGGVGYIVIQVAQALFVQP